MNRPLLRLGVMLTAAAGCSHESVIPDPDEVPPASIAVGETRHVELRYLRLDVEGFSKTNTLDDLRRMPRSILEDIWLLDLPVTELFANAVDAVRETPPAEVSQWPQPAQNMHRLLTMTPDNAELSGTNLEELVSLAGAVGIPPAKTLANLLEVDVTDDFIAPEVVTAVMLDQVAGTHPNAQFRRGPIDDAHPDGRWEVAPHSIPITLADVVTNFENLAERFGAAGDHPGFVVSASGVSVIEDEFKMTSKVNVNALPFKGVDLSDGTVASVNSVGGQVETLHDYSSDDWLVLEGLVENPTVESLTFAIYENDDFMAGGTSRDPAGKGNSPAWEIPTWEFESVLAEMSRRVAQQITPHCDTYTLATGAEAFTACIEEDGWVTMETFNNLGDPPAPGYLWDLNLEIAQARLHDGGLDEGEGDVELTVHDVAVGVPPEVLTEKVRENIEANPTILRQFAAELTDSTVGDADFFYVQDEDGDDWLFFVAEADLRLDADGDPVRDYDYEHPGFFDDDDLSEKVSDTREVDGDVDHEKVKIRPGDVLFVEDDDGHVFEIAVADKPSRSHLGLDVTRVR